MAKIRWVCSSKHSSRRSNPERDPKTENHGVQTWAGMTSASGTASQNGLDEPLGRDSEDRAAVRAARFPIRAEGSVDPSAASSPGNKDEEVRLVRAAVLLPDRRDLGRREEPDALVAQEAVPLWLKTFLRGRFHQEGWVKSPVPRRSIPFRLAQWARA